MQAILAMDAYNRTNNAAHPVRIKGLGGDGSPIGTASVLQIQTTPSGFVGVAYSMADGSTTISYRGTDFAGGPNSLDTTMVGD